MDIPKRENQNARAEAGKLINEFLLRCARENQAAIPLGPLARLEAGILRLAEECDRLREAQRAAGATKTPPIES